MKVIVIYGSMRKGSTYNCVQVFLESITDKITEKREFFLPKDMPHFCKGCFSCFINGEETCPHYKEMKLITKVLEDADLIILASPVYVSDVSGQMKSFLDHLAYRWMVHRPHPEMFKKIGLVISTAAGAGTRTTNKTMKRSLVFWGVNKIYSYGVNVAASEWNEVNIKKKKKIERQLSKLGNKIAKIAMTLNNSKPNYCTRMLFNIMKIGHKHNTWNETDYNYWKVNGWLNGKKPW